MSNYLSTLGHGSSDWAVMSVLLPSFFTCLGQPCLTGSQNRKVDRNSTGREAFWTKDSVWTVTAGHIIWVWSYRTGSVFWSASLLTALAGDIATHFLCFCLKAGISYIWWNIQLLSRKPQVIHASYSYELPTPHFRVLAGMSHLNLHHILLWFSNAVTYEVWLWVKVQQSV